MQWESQTPFPNCQSHKQKAPQHPRKLFSHTDLFSSIIVGIPHKTYMTHRQCRRHRRSRLSTLRTTRQYSPSLRLTAPEVGGSHPSYPFALRPAEKATRCRSRKLGWKGRDNHCCWRLKSRFYRRPWA